MPELGHWLGAMVIIIAGVIAFDTISNYVKEPEEQSIDIPLPLIIHESNKIIQEMTGNTITFIVVADKSTAVER